MSMTRRVFFSVLAVALPSLRALGRSHDVVTITLAAPNVDVDGYSMNWYPENVPSERMVSKMTKGTWIPSKHRYTMGKRLLTP